MDRAVSALLDDLASRGLLDETLVVMGSEFGRTPRITTLPGVKLPGRDHWGGCQSILLAGAECMGARSSAPRTGLGHFPRKAAQRPENLAATIYEALGLPRTAEWHDPLDRPHSVYDGEPIKGLT